MSHTLFVTVSLNDTQGREGFNKIVIYILKTYVQIYTAQSHVFLWNEKCHVSLSGEGEGTMSPNVTKCNTGVRMGTDIYLNECSLEYI